MKFRREFSAGCVVYKKLKVISLPASQARRGGQGHKSRQSRGSSIKASGPSVVFLIGKHSGYHKWVLPKGLIEEGERGWQTCVRETEEEMGIKAKLINKKPIHKIQYFFVANYKPQRGATPARTNSGSGQKTQPSRRVTKYQESGGEKTKVFKVVSFYLAKYLSGHPQKHDWEMEAAGWYPFKQALKKLAFPGEKEALKKAQKMIK